jgi:hypothetical protein
VILRPNSRSCRTASIRSGIAGGLAGELISILLRVSKPDVARFPSVNSESAAARSIVPFCRREGAKWPHSQ